MKRILSLVLIAAMLFGGFGCSTITEPEAAYHTGLSFSELEPSGKRVSLEIARAKELLFRIERGELSGDRAQTMLDAAEETYQALETDASIAYIRYCRDVTDRENKSAYDDLASGLEALGCILVDAALLLRADPVLRERYDAKTVDSLLREDALSDPAILPLIERERDLVGAYEALPERLIVERHGKRWTGDEILSDPTLSPEDFAALYEQYQDLFNREAGAIYLELIRVRRKIAKTLGFKSYAEYRYDRIGRSYTPADAAQLSEHVRDAFAPVLSQTAAPFYRAAGVLCNRTYACGPAMRGIGTAIAEMLPELSEPWTYMTGHGMFDLGTDPKRMPGSFTVYLADYGAPFLFSSWTNGFDMPPTVIHEFGHYASFYLRGSGTETEDALDLAEIDAQGLELLTVMRYDTIYGAVSDAAETAELFYALYALLDGCAEDAFQQYAYAQEEPTLEALNAEYERLIGEYGLDRFGAEARSWTQIPHTFQSPFYYISYAAGMLTALELYVMSKSDPDAAKEAYRAILTRTDGGLLRILKQAGLNDPFDPEHMRNLAHELERIQSKEETDGRNGTQNDR